MASKIHFHVVSYFHTHIQTHTHTHTYIYIYIYSIFIRLDDMIPYLIYM